MVDRLLGVGLRVSPIGYGAFKIGRNEGIKYPTGYELPDEHTVSKLLNGVLDLGIDYIDTAPAYGLSEERIGRALAHRRDEFTLSTKIGETFEDGRSSYDFSADAVRRSVDRSLSRLRTDRLDVVYVHSDGRDVEILERAETLHALQALQDEGVIQAVGFSPKTPEGATAAMAAGCSVLMLEYNLDEPAMRPTIEAAHARGVGVVIKKGLGSGHCDPAESIRFVLGTPGVTSLVVGSLNLEHLRENVQIAGEVVA